MQSLSLYQNALFCNNRTRAEVMWSWRGAFPPPELPGSGSRGCTWPPARQVGAANQPDSQSRLTGGTPPAL